jgi:hypothetical protein
VPSPRPPLLREPEDVGELTDIGVNWADAESPSKQRKRVDRWAAALPELSAVTSVWFINKVNQRVFDAACDMPALRTLRIKWSGIRSLDALRPTSPVREFLLGSSASLESITPLSQMTGLELLALENLKRVKALDALAPLTGLTRLDYTGGMDSFPRVHTIEPLGGLTGLRRLDLTCLRITDDSLRPLARLTALEHVAIPRWLPTEQYAFVIARVPAAALELHPVLRLGSYMVCPKCGAAEMRLPIGRGQRMLCEAHEPEKLAAWEASFQAQVEAHR